MKKTIVDKATREEKVIERQKSRISKKEKKLLQKEDNKFVKCKINPIKSMAQEKVPKKVRSGINKAFEKGFYFIFEKGTSIIEKSYNSKKIKDDADTNKYKLSKEISFRNLRAVDWNVTKGSMLSQGITAFEGTALGFLGVGMPDIPIFIGVILRTIYEICLKYGFKYDNDKEKVFIMNIICTGISNKEDRIKYSEECDKLSYAIDKNEDIYVNLDVMIKETSEKMVNCLLVSKFIQGIPFVGVIGGASNYMVLSSISRVAKLKYQKRFISKLQNKKTEI